MGYIEIIRPDNSGFSSEDGGELLPATFSICDRCGYRVNTKDGQYIEVDGLKIMWWCVACR